jgi:hypothetical protein
MKALYYTLKRLEILKLSTLLLILSNFFLPLFFIINLLLLKLFFFNLNDFNQ